MIIVSHRINTKKQLKNLDTEYGAEVDLRSSGKDIIINHEPFIKSIKFSEWLNFYNHKLLIANIKEEGIEKKVLKIINDNKIKNYFLLDVTIPQIIKLNQNNLRVFALRISKYESFLGLKNFNTFHKWLWIDTFDAKLPISLKDLKKLKSLGHKICLVSPELGNKRIDIKKEFIIKNKKILTLIDAVCTKKMKIWMNY